MLWFLSVGTSGREDIKERQFLDGSAHSKLGKAVKLPVSPSGNQVSDAWRLMTSWSDARGLVQVGSDSKTDSRKQKLCHRLDLDLGCWVLQYVFLQQAKEKQLAVLESQIP